MVILLLSLLSLVSPNLFVLQTLYCYRRRLQVCRTPWYKNLNFLKCRIASGFCKLGHIYVCMYVGFGGIAFLSKRYGIEKIPRYH